MASLDGRGPRATAARIIPGVQMPHCAPPYSHEGTLQRMASAQTLDGRDVRSGDLRERHEARIHRHAIDQHRAGAALAFAAAFLGAGQATRLAQHVEQARQRRRVDANTLSVQRELHVISFSGVAGISRRSKPA